MAVSGRKADDLNKLKPVSADDKSRIFFDANGNDDINNGTALPDPLLDKDNGYRGIKVTPRLTVWRTLHVETDWMGPPPKNEVFSTTPGYIDINPNGPVDKPDTGLFASAFAPAFVKVDVGTKNDNQTAWDHNMTSTEYVQRNQSDRKTGESDYYWVAYVQSAYEYDTTNDHDPDTQGGTLGITSVGDEDNNHIYGFPPHEDASFVSNETIRDVMASQNPGLSPADLSEAIYKVEQRPRRAQGWSSI